MNGNFISPNTINSHFKRICKNSTSISFSNFSEVYCDVFANYEKQHNNRADEYLKNSRLSYYE